MNTLIWIAGGVVAGMLARFVTGTRRRGFIADWALGFLGSVCGSWLLRLLYGEVAAGAPAHLITSFGGAILVVMLGRLLRRLLAQAESGVQAPAVGELFAGLEVQIHRLSQLERAALERILRVRAVQHDTEKAFRQQQSLGERVADRVATFGGSWTFLGCFAAFMLAWMFVNTRDHPSDPYPFILLNLILSCLAAVQAPVIMMSQNRQAAKDRFDAQQDYQVNVRAEMQIASLHLKLDETRSADIKALIALQERQATALEQLVTLLRRNGISELPE